MPAAAEPTAAPPVATEPPAAERAASTNKTAAAQLIDQRIEEARSALWWSELTRTGLKVVIGTMLALMGWLVMDHWFYSPGPLVRVICFVTLIAAAIWFFVRRAWPVMTSRVTREYAAWALEQDHADYRQQLTSYVTLSSDGQQRGVRARVVRAIGARAASLLKAHDTLPGEATGTFRWWITAAAVFAMLAAYCVGSPKSSLASAKRLVAPLASIDPAKRVQIRDVQPGDAEVIAGRDVKVSAKVDGLRSDEVVVCRWSTNGPSRQSELALDPGTGQFVGTLRVDHSTFGAVSYSIEAGDAVAGPFQLDVENVPVVAIESVFYQPPEYTNLKARTTSSPAISAIDGTKVRINAKTNRPIARAELQFNSKLVGKTIRVTGGSNPISIAKDGVTLTADVTLHSAIGKTTTVELENYRIRVWDSNDQPNPDPIVYPIKVVADLPPEVTIVVPKQSPVKLPLNAQQIIEVHAMDADFELQQVSLHIERGINTLDDPIIWVKPIDGSGRGNHVAEYRFRPLEHLLRPGDDVHISATARDNRSIPDDPKVKPNESTTDSIKFTITEDEQALPEDPTENDGLSRTDDRPASAPQPSKEGGDGQQSSGGGSSGGEGAQGKESTGENAGGQGTSGGPSDQQNSGDQENADSESNDQPSDGGGTSSADPSPAESDPNGKSPQNSSGGDSTGAEGSDPANSDPANNNPMPSDNEGSKPSDPSTDHGGKQEGTGEQQEGSGEQAGDASGQPGDQRSGQKSNAQSDQNSAGSDTNSGGSDATDNQSKSSDANSDSDGTGRSPDPAETPESGQDQSGQDAQGKEGSGGDPSQSAPKHDGEAIERIKDFIEKQKQNQNQGGASQQSPDNSGKQAATEKDDGGKSPAGSDPKQDAPASNQSTTDQSDTGGEKGSESADGKTEPGDQQSTGNDTPGEQGTNGGEPQKSDSGPPEQNPADERSDESDSKTPAETGSKAGEENSTSGNSKSPSQQTPADKTEQQSENNSEPADSQQQPGESSGPPPKSSSTDGQKPSQEPPQSSSSSTGGAGSGNGSAEDGDTGAEPPPPPDLEYAKKATDMVLDYLDETRDQVDEDLLKELDWTEQDLQRFRERWEKVRQMDQPNQDASPQNEFEDALRSLGLQPNQSPGQSTQRSADTLRNLRDSGNRRKAPPALRDAFDAFRRRK